MSPRDLGALLLLAGIWGSSFLFIRLGVEEMPPLDVVFLRLALGAMAAGTVAWALGIRGVGEAFRRPAVLINGLCSTGVPFILYAYGETRVASGVAGISNATAPLFAVLIAQAVPLRHGGERMTPRLATGLAIGFAGVCLLASDGISGALDLAGLLMCLGAPVLYAVGALLFKSVYRGYDPVVAAVSGTGLAALAILPAALVVGRPDHNPGAKALLAVAALGIFGTGFAFVISFRLLRKVGTSRTLMVTYLMPVVAVVEGAVFVSEPVRAVDFIALAAILVGVGVANGMVRLPARRRRRDATADPEAVAVVAAELPIEVRTGTGVD